MILAAGAVALCFLPRGAGAAPLSGELDESVNWTVTDPVDTDFAETPVPQPKAAREPRPAPGQKGFSPFEETAATQPVGGLSDIIVYTSAGHGACGDTGSWVFGRGLTNGVVEDIGNIDQLSYFADYCFQAGATVVPMRPLGHQTNEVVLDNTNTAAVTFGGSWNNSSSTTFYGEAGATPYRYAYINETGTTAWAIYRPTIPNAGFYPVYAWTRSGSDRVKQLYRVYHSGGVTDVRVNHERVGLGWIWLGTYYFEAGTNGSVNISNHAPGYTPGNDVVIADAIRFGNGMGDINRGSGVSGLPRELEGNRYWIQRMVGQGMSSTLYDLAGYSDVNDNVGAPVRMAAEMNRESDGTIWDRIYLGFHSNAGSGAARGPMGLWDTRGTTTKQNRQKDYGTLIAEELDHDLSYGDAGVWFPDSHANTSGDLYGSAYGELYGTVNDEMNSTIIEVAFHDNVDDAKLLRDPAARRVMAMASYQAIVKHLTTNNPAVVSPVLLPDPPTHVAAANDGTGAVTIRWRAPVTNTAGGAAATGYMIYRSTNGFGFGNPVPVSGGGTTNTTVTNMPAGQLFYFQVCATNAGGESLPSETLGVRVSSSGQASRLVVNGFDRNEQRISPTRYVTNNINGNVTRVIQRQINSHDYVIQHGAALAAAGRDFDSCANEAVADGDLALTNYHAAFWILGRESTSNETFSAAEQTAVSAFLSGSGNLFVSGTELAWDLDHLGSSADKLFITNVLKTAYGADDAGTGTVTATAGGLLDGLGTFAFDYAGTGTLYRASYPDRFEARGTSAATSLVYGASAAGTSGAVIQHSNATYRTVIMGFPFETMFGESNRFAVMSRVVDFFDAGMTSSAPVTIMADDFEDGDLAGWTQDTAGNWANSGTDPVAGARSLRHNLSSVAVTNHVVAQPVYSLSADTTTWRVKLKNGNWDPSGANHFHVYLMASDSDLTGGTVDGYAVGVNLSGTDDLVKLWRVTDGAADATVLASALNWNASMTNAIEVTRTTAGLWELKTSTNGTFSGMTSAGTATDTTYSDTTYFGLVFGCTSSRAGLLWLDDVLIHQGDVSVATDTDGDGVDDYSEGIAGTSPSDPNDVLALNPLATDTNAATLELRWPSVTGRVYSIWAATNAAGVYTQHIGGLTATVPTNAFTNSLPAGPGQTYYGIRVGLAP